MAEAAGSPQRQRHRSGSLLGHPNLHLGGPVNDIADLCQLLLLLLLPPQDKDEGIKHLRECSPHEGETGRGEKGPQKNNKRLFSADYSPDIRDFSVSFERH